jgi:hypothetical protein
LVASFTDQSGNGNHLAQTSDARKPVYKTDQHTLPVLAFDGVSSGDRLFVAGTLNHPVTVFIVFRQNSWQASEIIFDGITDNSLGFQQLTATPNLALFAGAVMDVPNLPIGQWGLITLVYNGANSVARADGGSQIDGNCGANTSCGGLDLGAQGNSRNSHIDVGELLIYSGVESLSANESGLMTKWGIS